MKTPVLLMALELGGGGSERQLTEIALGLKDSPFEPYVAALRPGGLREPELQAAGIPIEHFPFRSFKSIRALSAAENLRRFIGSKKVRLVHAFDAPTSVFATPVTRYLTKAVMLTSQRGHRDLTPEYRKLLRWSDRRTNAIVVNCDYLRRYLIEDESVAESRIHVCRNGIDLEKFHPGPAVRPANLPDGALVIGVVSMLRPEKDVATLIRAFALLKRDKPIKLAIVGSGPEFESLQTCAREAGIAGDIVWQSQTGDVTAWLRHIDIFVLPSRNEAFPNAAMEAMACGCAVVASNVGGVPELIEHGRTGLLFKPGDAQELACLLEDLIGDPESRRTMASAGTRFVQENLSRHAAVSRMSEIYSNALKNTGGGERTQSRISV